MNEYAAFLRNLLDKVSYLIDSGTSIAINEDDEARKLRHLRDIAYDSSIQAPTRERVSSSSSSGGTSQGVAGSARRGSFKNIIGEGIVDSTQHQPTILSPAFQRVVLESGETPRSARRRSSFRDSGTGSTTTPRSINMLFGGARFGVVKPLSKSFLEFNPPSSAR